MFHDPLSLILAAAAFGLVLSIWLVLVLLWSLGKKRRLDEVGDRLKLVRGVSPEHGEQGRVLRLWRDGKEATTVVPGIETGRGLLKKLEKLRADAGMESSLKTAMLSMTATVSLVAVIAYLISSSVLMTIACPVAVLILMYIVINQRIAKRQTTFERQLTDALDLAARSLRVGHPLIGSFQMISREIPAPIGTLFGDVCQQQELGVALDQSLRAIAIKSRSDDLRLFATSVVIQLRSGGNLADMMERLANVIRERNRLARRVQVLTAQTQFSKRVLLALPFFIFVMLNLINPDYMRPLYTTFTGELIMAAALVGLLLGWITMNWLSRLSL